MKQLNGPAFYLSMWTGYDISRKKKNKVNRLICAYSIAIGLLCDIKRKVSRKPLKTLLSGLLTTSKSELLTLLLRAVHLSAEISCALCLLKSEMTSLPPVTEKWEEIALGVCLEWWHSWEGSLLRRTTQSIALECLGSKLFHQGNQHCSPIYIYSHWAQWDLLLSKWV